ncbi:MAG: hypothetical protein QXT13_11335 [Pyrobaculum sp.]
MYSILPYIWVYIHHFALYRCAVELYSIGVYYIVLSLNYIAYGAIYILSPWSI